MKTAGYLLFLLAFLMEALVASLHWDRLETLSPWTWVLVSFAAFRTARALSYNVVFAWLRAPFCRVEIDSSGAGDSVVPRERIHPLLYAIGDCLACPICTGTHAGTILLALIAWVPSFGLVMTFALGVAGVAEVLHWLSEMMEWKGRANREISGTYWLQKNIPEQTERRHADYRQN